MVDLSVYAFRCSLHRLLLTPFLQTTGMAASARELARLLPTSVPSVLAFQQLREALSMSQRQLDAALSPRGGTLAALKLSAGSTKVVNERLARFEKPKGPSIIFMLGSEHAGKRVLFDVLSVYLIIVAAITVLSARPKHRSVGATEILGQCSCYCQWAAFNICLRTSWNCTRRCNQHTCNGISCGMF